MGNAAFDVLTEKFSVEGYGGIEIMDKPVCFLCKASAPELHMIYSLNLMIIITCYINLMRQIIQEKLINIQMKYISILQPVKPAEFILQVIDIIIRVEFFTGYILKYLVGVLCCAVLMDVVP